MTVYTNENGEIKDVKPDSTLTPVEITDGTFDGWSAAKICCYKVNVVDGNVVMLTPYVDSRLIEHIDMLGREVESVTPYKDTKKAYIDDTEVIFTDVPQGNMTVFCPVDYTVERTSNMVTVSFEPLIEVTEITIMIQ